MAGRTTGPASRPPRRGSGARSGSTGRSGGARTSSGRTQTSRTTGASAAKASTARTTAAKTPAASAAARSSASSTTTAKVVRRTPTAWRSRATGAVSGRIARRAAVLGTILVFLAVLLASSVAAWFGQRSDIAALQDQVQAQQADVEALRAERERWNDPAYVEQQARERLKFVRPGERAFTVLDPEPADGSAPVLEGPGAGDVEPLRPWYDTVWQSVRTADAPGAQQP